MGLHIIRHLCLTDMPGIFIFLYYEREERLARFEEIRYPDGDLAKADKKLQEYKKEFADTGLSEVQDSWKSDAVKLWNRLYKYCDTDTIEWIRELIDKKYGQSKKIRESSGTV